MNLMDIIYDKDIEILKNRMFGVYPALVTMNNDPDNFGRVKVRFPWLSDTNESSWARVATLMAGNDRGFYFLPEVDDEVLVAFENGDISHPYIIGSLWNGQDHPPEKNDDGKNDVRMIKSRCGHIIKLNDQDGKESIEVIDKSGANSIIIDSTKNTLTINMDKDVTVLASNGTIKLNAQNIEIKSSAAIKIESGASMDIKGATVNIN